MRCPRARKYISEYVDGSLEARKAVELERHIEKCAACQEVLADFRAMTAAASRLDGPEPGDAVWLKIKGRLGARATEPAAVERVPGRWTFGWSSPALRFAGAAALILILVASGVVIGIRLTRPEGLNGLGDREKYTLAKLDEAEQYYQKAIKSLDEAFSAQKGTMIPQVAEMFEKNLSVIDATIQACRQAVLNEPDDLQARNYLLAAYMDKVTFLDTALEFQRQTLGVGTRGKSL
jgi:tetratricopeptide (TPR) repeat protein